MVSFLVYDLIFLVLFSAFVTWFLVKTKKGISREGIIFMYRTQWGIKLINYIGSTYKKTLQALRWPIVIIGLFLMGIMMWMLGQTLSIYILFPEITKMIKAPPIAPLIPYFPKLFGMESFFPPFYFTYFIVALAIVAIVHEFSHGIFMKRFGVKIKSTGIVFLGPILGAFVEEERKGFEKKKNLEQMTILGAGVFANIIFALIFYLLYVLFFFTSFTATGYVFDSYGVAAVPLENITGFNEIGGNLTQVQTDAGSFYLDQNLAIQLTDSSADYLIAYPESPAVLAQIKGAIIMADDVRILGQEDLRTFVQDKNPGDRVNFKTENIETGETQDYSLLLGEHPENKTKAYLGVGNSNKEPRGIVQKFFSGFMKFKDQTTHYKPKYNMEFVVFIYHLLWWVMIINLLVALFNMMPLGILDGGRFFYLAILSITKSEKTAKHAYNFMKYLILFIFVMLMFFWFIRII